VVTSVRTTYLERERERETDVLTNDLSGSGLDHDPGQLMAG